MFTEVPHTPIAFGMIDATLTSLTLTWIPEHTGGSTMESFVLDYGVMHIFDKSKTFSSGYNETIINELVECTIYNVRLKTVNMIANSKYRFINVSTFCKYIILFSFTLF